MSGSTVVTQSNIPEQSPYSSTGGVDWTSGSADDYLSLDDRVRSDKG